VAVDRAGAATADAMADAADSAQLLGVDVDELAWLIRGSGLGAVGEQPPVSQLSSG
jgi:hypothetical protein